MITCAESDFNMQVFVVNVIVDTESASMIIMAILHEYLEQKCLSY